MQKKKKSYLNFNDEKYDLNMIVKNGKIEIIMSASCGDSDRNATECIVHSLSL